VRREQNNPKAASDRLSGVNKNPLHHRSGYRTSDFPANRKKRGADERTRTPDLLITSALSYVYRCFSEFQDPHTEGKLANMGVPCISRRSLRLPSRLLSRHEDMDVEPNLTAFSLQVTIGVP